MGVYNPKYTGIYVGKDKYITNEEVCDILARIVGCDSVTGHEGACGRVIASICEEYGLKYEMVEADENRPNVMITLGADSYLDKKLGLLFEGHYDTVPVMEMEHPFDTAIVDNKMWGRGIVDQKSGVVSALCAAIAVKRSGKTLKKPICVALVIDEESEHRGGYALAESKLQAEYAFTTEPTNRVTCEFGCRGTTPIRIHIEGLTAHASTPYRGINSIQKALPILNALFALEFPEVDLGKFGVYRNSICVSMIEAGSAYNNVPGEAVIWMDCRTVPGTTSADMLNLVKSIVDDAKKADPQLKATVEIARPDWHWEPIKEHGLNATLTDPETELYNVLCRAGKKCGIETIEKRFSNGYNDMDFLVNDLGIPTITYSAGQGEMSHSPREEVDIDEICQVTDVFCNAIEELCM